MKNLDEANAQLKKNIGEHVSQSEYAQIIESLWHLMNFTRSNIAYDIGRLNMCTQNLNKEHGLFYTEY